MSTITTVNIGTFENYPIQPFHLGNILMEVFGEKPIQSQPINSSSSKLSDFAKELPLRILVAEDCSIHQTIALRILRSLGYTADVVNNGVEALEKLRQHHYDVLLTDVKMPEMGGLEVARWICQEWSLEERPCMIAITSEVMPDVREECLKAGMNECVSKPLQINELVQVLRTCPFSKEKL
ncbi:MAG TPA: hypothetical protein DCL61_13485 [Cyanobacteria bacterium UBA12227]|nr:hypothetical protein [Cyanobacteria bacterium UBA12227]HAX84879.1 hypothetical protein [Cyanobacteria bacterium UBA11370]HBY80726.1 hypothetical protein [Cyanobacteria bacterium UBA11148]